MRTRAARRGVSRKTLTERTAVNPAADVPELGVMLMDGAATGCFALTADSFLRRGLFLTASTTITRSVRHQRRDHFGQPRTSDRKGHWKEDKVGLALSMDSEVFESDPTSEFPEWLVGAKVVSEIAKPADPRQRIHRAPLGDRQKTAYQTRAASSFIFGVGWHVLTNGKGVAGGRTTLATPFGKPQDVPPENLDLTEHLVEM